MKKIYWWSSQYRWFRRQWKQHFQQRIVQLNIPFGVTLDMVDIKATMLDFCCRWFGVFVVSFRKHGEMFHHCLMCCNDIEINRLTIIVGALVRRCCNLDLVRRRNLITFVFVGHRGAFEWQCDLIVGAFLVASDQVCQLLFVQQFWEEFCQHSCPWDFLLTHTHCENILLLLERQTSKIVHYQLFVFHDDCIVILWYANAWLFCQSRSWRQPESGDSSLTAKIRLSPVGPILHTANELITLIIP